MKANMIAVHLECTSVQVITNAQVIVTLLHSTKENAFYPCMLPRVGFAKFQRLATMYI